ncbi:hypothetical protein [Desulfogranum japonicum]|uniref:hypothetical protein n=1 Tax=Desulfogranum japonicum TaxID=231447 RepID=UPI000405950B|nr:hypothetical protein [Desulfogranum japonicum]
MNIQIEQGCPQCGATIVLTENDRLITCSYCGVKNYLQSKGVFRYLLPPKLPAPLEGNYLMVPYIRFKGTIFMVSHKGITHKVVDTTQVASALPGLQPSLGLRPQAMKLQRLTAQLKAEYCVQSIASQAILAKAVQISELTTTSSSFFHRAYIGENLSIIYLPLVPEQEKIFDAVTRNTLMPRTQMQEPLLRQTVTFKPSWQVQSRASLCPHCGAGLEGESDTLVLHCINCRKAWTFGSLHTLKEVIWKVMAEVSSTAMYLPFWIIQGRIPSLGITHLTDFFQRTNQPVLPREHWRNLPMRFVIPGFKMRPKLFLQAGKQGTLNQWRIIEEKGRFDERLFYPVTLPASEALQSVKVILAACATSQKHIFPHLPQVALCDHQITLLYVPFQDRGHDWYQPELGIPIGKNILRFGRSM